MLNMLPKLELVPISNSGVGGLLLDACRIAQLDRVQPFDDPRLLERVLDSARGGLENSLESGEFSRPESQRLAFRELGLAIGLQAADFIPKPTVAVVDEFDAYPGARNGTPGIFGSRARSVRRTPGLRIPTSMK